MATVLLTPAEAAERLGIHINTLFRWRRDGVGPAYIRLSRNTIRYPEETLLIQQAA